jgi:hypothetical protein
MLTEFIAVLGTLSGVVVGGLINYFSVRSVKNHEWRLSLAKDQAFLRQKLYAELLIEVQRLVVLARENSLSSLNDFNHLNAKLAEVSLVAPEYVMVSAKVLTDYALTSHGTPSATEASDFFKLKDEFIAAARKDVKFSLSDS